MIKLKLWFQEFFIKIKYRQDNQVKIDLIQKQELCHNTKAQILYEELVEAEFKIWTGWVLFLQQWWVLIQNFKIYIK